MRMMTDDRGDMPWVTGTSQVFATIAHPADHVRAPMVFNRLFAEHSLDRVMVPLDVPPAALEDMVTALRGMANFHIGQSNNSGFEHGAESTGRRRDCC